jgi:hypothetical protein
LRLDHGEGRQRGPEDAGLPVSGQLSLAQRVVRLHPKQLAEKDFDEPLEIQGSRRGITCVESLEGTLLQRHTDHMLLRGSRVHGATLGRDVAEVTALSKGVHELTGGASRESGWPVGRLPQTDHQAVMYRVGCHCTEHRGQAEAVGIVDHCREPTSSFRRTERGLCACLMDKRLQVTHQGARDRPRWTVLGLS